MNYDPNVYGYVNGEPVYSRDEFVFKCRRRGAIEDDAELLAFAEKASGGWYHAGHKRKFVDFYLSDYALAEPRHSLSDKEFARLKELQAAEQEKARLADEAREWRFVEKVYWADNSVEEIYEDKNGERKVVMVVGPHGDACY